MEYTFILFILLGIITFSISLEIIQIQNSILPISLGKAYVTHKNLQLLYHIDLAKIEQIIINYQTEIDNYKNSKLNFAQTANYRYLRHSNEINLNALEELLNEKIRIKRGLINLGGKISKFLFGTLDSDDEALYQSYFNSIKNNEQILFRNQKQIATIVNDLKNKYISKFQKMSENLKLFQIVPELHEVQQMHLLIFELKDIKNILDEIQTAVSFARLHLLHESVLPYSKFLELIKNENIIPVHHLKDYYQLCHTKVIFKNKILLFLISIPLVQKEYYDLYKFYYLPQNNESLPYTNPYLLSQEEKLKWSTKHCHPVENDYLCDQDSLEKIPKCLENILTNHTENCQRIPKIPTQDLKILEDGSILSIQNEKIIEKCPLQTKHHFLPTMAILRTKCTISNKEKEIVPTTNISEERIVLLQTPHKLPQEYTKEEHQPEDDIPDIELEETNQWNLPQTAFNSFFYLIILIIIITTFYFIFKLALSKNNLCKNKATPIGDTFNQNGEELCNANPGFL